MKVLITGAGGFLGRHIAKKLLAKNYSVFNFSRSIHPALDDLGVVSIRGDLSDPEAISRGCRGMDAVIHTAAKVGMSGKWKDFYQTNCQGTRNLLSALKENGVKKLVHTSTPSVVFGQDDIRNGDETLNYPERFLTHYARSKAIAEKMVLDANDPATLSTVALRPHLIFGPDDPHLIPGLLNAARKGRLKIIGNGENKVDVIYVENAADAHLCALEKLQPDSPVSGKAYFLGQDRPVNLWDFINLILTQSKLPPVDKKIPESFAYAAGGVFELIWKVAGITETDPPMTRFIARQLAKSHYFNHSAAATELGYRPAIDTDEAIKRLRRRKTLLPPEGRQK